MHACLLLSPPHLLCFLQVVRDATIDAVSGTITRDCGKTPCHAHTTISCIATTDTTYTGPKGGVC